MDELVLQQKRRVEELERLTYVVAHDLKEPARNIQVFSQLLQRDYAGKLGSEADEYLGFITQNARRMQLLLNDFIDFARNDTNPLPFTEVSVKALFAKVKADLCGAIEESGARLFESDSLPSLVTRERALYQVLSSLVSNAIKFRRKGHLPEIKIDVVERPGDWLFSVTDNGLGIESRHWETIFILFKRLHAADQYTGSGVGLALCRKNLESLGGKVWVESTLGQGSTFFFTLPRGNGTPPKA